MSDIIRLNKNCLENIEKIRNLAPNFADPKVFDITKCSNSYIVEYALHWYADELSVIFDFEKEDHNEST